MTAKLPYRVTGPAGFDQVLNARNGKSACRIASMAETGVAHYAHHYTASRAPVQQATDHGPRTPDLANGGCDQ